MLNKLITFLILALFGSYWSLTVFFNMPDNYGKITMPETEQKFNTFFYQKWTFFAPPPKHNDRLYYLFRSKGEDSTELIFEALNTIYSNKRKNAPFNEYETVVDYMVSGSVFSLTGTQREYAKSIRYAEPDSSEVYYTVAAMEKIWEREEKPASLQTLINYGKITARKNQIDLNNYEMKIIIAIKGIPKFKDRANPEAKTEEEKKTFETPYFEI